MQLADNTRDFLGRKKNLIARKDFSASYLDFDWSLNER